jgi:thymidylate synthase (FAD)
MEMKATLVDNLGDDLTVVNAARVSFDKESEWICMRSDSDPDNPALNKDWLSEKDKKLISYLAKHSHWTPFSHPQITIRMKVPIFVARQDFKHIVGFTRNEVSRRYVDSEPEFYVPDVWRSRPEGSVKQGSGEDHPAQVSISKAYELAYKGCLGTYNSMLEIGVAPEQARMVLPQSMYTEYWTTGSLAAWARAYKQRTDSHAQQEIQEIYKQVGEIIQPLYPVSWEALTSG